MTMTMVMPAQQQRRTTRRDPGLDVSVDPARTTLMRMLAMSGWTILQIESLRGVPTPILTVLVRSVAPDRDLYLAWAEAARRNRMTSEVFTETLGFALQHDMTPDEVTALIQHGRGEGLAEGTRTAWLREHLRAGNRVEDVRLWGRHAPAWIVAWCRTRIPPTHVPEVMLDELRLWRFMVTALEHPELPEAVIAHTLTHAPDPYAEAPTSGAWLLACWNPQRRAA